MPIRTCSNGHLTGQRKCGTCKSDQVYPVAPVRQHAAIDKRVKRRISLLFEDKLEGESLRAVRRATRA